MEIEIHVENNNQNIYLKQGATLDTLRRIAYPSGGNIVAAYVNNKIKELNYQLFTPKSVRFIELNSTEGFRVYSRSLSFVLQKAVLDVMGERAVLRMMHPIGRNYYAQIQNCDFVCAADLDKIKGRMNELIQADIPIVREKIELSKARQIFASQGYDDKITLMDTRPQYYVSVFSLAGLQGFFYGAMVSSTGCLKTFDIVPYINGIALLLPSKGDLTVVEPLQPFEKLSYVFRRYQQWVDILGIDTVGALNKKILDGKASEMIKIGEALQEKNISDIADTIADGHYNGKLRIILIAGPSSSGKTSFAKRLSIQLQVMGLTPEQISLDDYFVERTATPRDENGEFDFEALEAIDINTFNNDLNALLSGQTIKIPTFNFLSGSRTYSGRTMTLASHSVIIVEGIHALNPSLIPHIDSASTFKIYASALTAVSMDNMTTIHTTDNRLLRRIVRDNSFRGRSAFETLCGWQSVRRGEEKHIFPFQEQADIMFNTALFFEFSILKKFATPLLLSVPANEPQYAEALRLLKFLDCFTDIPDAEVPQTSILREFIGGSSFGY